MIDMAIAFGGLALWSAGFVWIGRRLERKRPGGKLPMGPHTKYEREMYLRRHAELRRAYRSARLQAGAGWSAHPARILDTLCELEAWWYHTGAPWRPDDLEHLRDG